MNVTVTRTLGQQQRRFPPLVAKLIQWIYANGYECTGGEWTRTSIQANADALSGIGISNSLHLIRLAIDLNLFKDGVYLTDSVAYAPLGTYWKSLDPDCAWGGDFHKPDGNHFSLKWNGVR